jgi:hypothetical protein
VGKYNVQWLNTEYNTVVRSARMAANWKKFEEKRKIFPNVEFMRSTSLHKRADHEDYVGTILPLGDPWWNTHTPPLDWGCKCWVRQTRGEPTGTPDEGAAKPVPPVFRNNPGTSAEPLVLTEHPYYTKTAPAARAAIKAFLEKEGMVKVVDSLKENAGFEKVKTFKNGGLLQEHTLLDKKKSDYTLVKNIGLDFAKAGEKVKLTPQVHFKSEEYKQIYGKLEGTKYARKCPDLLVGGKFYEVEGYKPPFKKEKINGMVSKGLKQSPYIIINNTKGASDRYIRKIIFDHIRSGSEVKEVWLYEKGKIRKLY